MMQKFIATFALITFCLSQQTDSNVEIIFLHVISTIEARFATTLVSSYVANRDTTAKEITFTAQLPDAAFISNFSMQIDEKIIYGKVEDKDQAKAEFDAAKARGESTGLVAKTPRETNLFTISVNIAAQSKIRFNLTYQEILKRVHGVYKQIINLQPNQPVSQLKCDIYITEKGEITNVKVPKFGEKVGLKTNKELLTAADDPNVDIKPVVKQDGISSIHIRYQPMQRSKSEILNGQLVVLYDVKRDQGAGDIKVVNGYFVHFFAPGGLKKRAKNIVFVLDKSGSMEGRKISQLRDAMKVILNDLSSDDRFQILFFSDTVEYWKKESSIATADNIKAAINFVQQTEADGGTNIYDAMQETIKALKKISSSTSVPMILFLTDGEPTVGTTDADRIVNDVTNANDQKKILIHCIAFGDDSDYNILQRISGHNRGLARKVYEDSDASIQLAGFYDEISSPLITDLKIDYLNENVDVTSIVNESAHNYYDGSEVLTLGKVKTTREFDAKVSGQGATGTISLTSRSSPMIACLPRVPIYYDDIEVAAARPAIGGVAHPVQSLWCCPPPHCCWWTWCPPPPPQPTPPPQNQPLPSNTAGGFIERMWAYQTIKKLLRQTDLREGSKGQDAKQKALDLSLKYHFVTELTSMVVVKPDSTKDVLVESQAVPPQSGGGVASGAGGAAISEGTALGAKRPGISAIGPAIPVAPPPLPTPAPVPPKTITSNGNSGNTDQSKPSGGQNPGGCKQISEVVFVRDSDGVSQAVSQNRINFAKATVKKLQTIQTVAFKGAVVDVSNGHGSGIHSIDNLNTVLNDLGQPTKSGNSATTVVQAVDSLFDQYSATNVKRYVIFLAGSSSLQYAVDASTSLRRNGVFVYVVSFSNDNSSGFSATLSNIAQDQAKIFRVPPSTGEQLAQSLSQC